VLLVQGFVAENVISVCSRDVASHQLRIYGKALLVAQEVLAGVLVPNEVHFALVKNLAGISSLPSTERYLRAVNLTGVLVFLEFIEEKVVFFVANINLGACFVVGLPCLPLLRMGSYHWSLAAGRPTSAGSREGAV